jgi:ribosomal protein S6--L-glutamate ligase
MNILILSRSPALFSTRRLVETIVDLGHSARVVNPLASVLRISNGDSGITYNGAALPKFDAAIPRIGPSATTQGIALLRFLEDNDTACINGSTAVSLARDKLSCLQVLSRKGIPVPRTVFAAHAGEAGNLAEHVGGFPVVLKLLNSSQGMGVMIADSLQNMRSVIDSLQTLGQSVLVQEFIASARGRDIRALVVGNEVVAAVRRHAAPGDFRANMHRGGWLEPLKLSPEYRRLALAAARAGDLEVAGVDMIDSESGPLVMELNASPGLEGIETATGVNVAYRIIQRTIERVHRSHGT